MTTRLTILSSVSLLAAAAAASGACSPKPSGQPGPDASVAADASAPPCPTWYQDGDGDGHGDAAVTKVACSQPVGFVASSDDCDDGSAFRFPGNREVCDQLDNDCSSETTEVCPPGCDVRVRPGGNRYLFCTHDANARLSFNNAIASCSSLGYKLVKIDDADENAWVTGNLTDAVTYPWIGLTDQATEGTWRWVSDNTLPTFTSWYPGQPSNFDGTEDCAVLLFVGPESGQWAATSCGYIFQYICERPE